MSIYGERVNRHEYHQNNCTFGTENIVGKVEMAGKQALKDMNIIKKIAHLALKGCSTFLSHFVAHQHAFSRCAAPKNYLEQSEHVTVF